MAVSLSSNPRSNCVLNIMLTKENCVTYSLTRAGAVLSLKPCKSVTQVSKFIFCMLKHLFSLVCSVSHLLVLHEKFHNPIFIVLIRSPGICFQRMLDWDHIYVYVHYLFYVTPRLTQNAPNLLCTALCLALHERVRLLMNSCHEPSNQRLSHKDTHPFS